VTRADPSTVAARRPDRAWLTSRSDRPQRARDFQVPRWAVGYLFIAPAILYFVVLDIYPLISTVLMSFTDVKAGVLHQVGLAQYQELFQDRWFWNSVRISVIFSIASTCLHLTVGLSLALLLNENWPSTTLRNVLRGVFILPYAFSTASCATMWGLLYHAFGVLNYMAITYLHVPGPIEFLSPDTALAALIIVNAWKSYPFYLITILGGLQSIPQDLYEAAKVDGASAFGRFRHITLPLLRQVLVIVSTIDLIATMGAMDLVNILTQGGPMRSTETLAYYIYTQGIQDGNLGYGAAVSTVMLTAMLILASIYLRMLTRGGESGETSF